MDGVNRGALREYTVYAGGCHTIYATFARCQYTVVASTGTGGSIYPPGNSVVQHGGNITYTLVPNDNYHIGSVIVNDSNLGPLPVYTFTNVQANNTIQAIFAINTYGASTDATLSNLTLNTGTLSPAFNAATTIYTVNVANSVASITLTATKNHANATVTGDSVKSLSIGANFFSILVTAENGITTKTYTVVVNRAAAIGVSNDATLSNLAVSQGTLNPTFNADSISYSVAVPYSVASITLTATKNHANATVIGDSVKVLNIGANTFNIVVTAEDGTTKKTYTVVVTRESPATAVNAENVSTLKLYPNPVTNGELIVENEEWKAGEVIEMYNLSGALVGTRRVEEKNTSVNVANLPNGNYVLKVGRYSAKFVKQ